MTNMQVWPDAHPDSMLSGQNGMLVKSTHMVRLICSKLLLKCMTQFVIMTHKSDTLCKLVTLQKLVAKHPLLGKAADASAYA